MIARTFALALVAFALGCAPAGAVEIKTVNTIKDATVWFAEDHTVPMIAMEVSLPAGSVYDPPGKAGLASFAGSLLDEGAAGLDSRAFHNALADRAIQLSVTAERDYLEITLVTQTANAADAFRLLGSALQHPRFDGEAIARVRAQILDSIANDDGDPESLADKTFVAAYFGNHPYAHPKDGDAQGVGAISANDLRAFVRTHWVRRGLKIAISGDTRAAALAPLLATAFAGLPGSAPPSPPPVNRTGKAGTQFVAMDVPQPNVVFGVPGLPRSDRDYLASYVANEIVGGGDGARLTTEIREKRGLTYDASSDVVPLNRATVIQGEVATRRESVTQSIALIREVFRKFANEGATDQELVDAKTYLTGSFPLSFASNADTVSQLATFQQEGLDPGYIARRNSLIDAVTADDIRRVAKRLFDPSHLTIVVVGTPADTPKKKR
jgi:zinc protease